MDQARLQDLFDYVKQGANLADLEAAGFTQEEIRSAQTPSVPSRSIPLGSQGTIEPYQPTRRQQFGYNVEEGLTRLGLPSGVAENVAEGVAGTSANTYNTGLAGFTCFSKSKKEQLL